MKHFVVAAWCFFSSLHGYATSLTEENIVGAYLLSPHESVDLSTGHALPVYFTLTNDYAVDFVFDGEPSIASQCETSWTLREAVLRATLDCTAIFPSIKPLVMELDLSDATQESLDQAKGIELSAAFSDLFGPSKSFSGTVLLRRAPQGPLDLNELLVSSGEGTGLKRWHADNELGFSDGRIVIRLVFDENTENLNTLELFQSHLKQVYLEIAFKISSREIETAQLQPIETITFKSVGDERIQFNVAGVIETLYRDKWEGGVDGAQVYEEEEVSIPYNINFDLEILKRLNNLK